ncbi:MAG: glycosyltransferase family 1 protein, partial [Nitrospiraceae bacterium]
MSCYLSHQVLCVCDSLRAVVISERICRGKKIKVLANGSIKGIDADSFRPLKSEEALSTRAALGIPPQEVVLGFVGRVVRDKGLVELAQAWRRLRESFDGMHLLIVGPFEPQDPLPSPTEQFLRTDPSIHLVGWAEDPRPLYAAMDLFVLPSYREGFGNVLLEAAAMELAVVATRIPGCLDAVQDGVTGTLVPPYDSEAL